MFRAIPFVIGCLALIGSPPCLGRTAGSFRVFDATQYSGKPDLVPYGIESVHVVYESAFWRKGMSRDRLPAKHRVQELARKAIAKNEIVVLDIERWRLHGDSAVVAENIRKYITVMQWFREAAPSLQVGYFGILPVAGDGRAMLPRSSYGYRRWQDTNARLRPIAAAVELILPEAYTVNDNIAGWVRGTEAGIRAAHNYGRPVYVFLWPQFSGHNPEFRGKYLPAAVWAKELDIVWRHADGVVIWGGWDSRAHKGAKWNPDASWWQVTKRFLCAKRLVSVRAVCPKRGHTDSAPAAPARPRLSGSQGR